MYNIVFQRNVEIEVLGQKAFACFVFKLPHVEEHDNTLTGFVDQKERASHWFEVARGDAENVRNFDFGN